MSGRTLIVTNDFPPRTGGIESFVLAMAQRVRRAGVRRTVATAHGHEIWWASVPVTRPLMRAIGERNDVVTYLGEYCRRRISAALSPAARSRMQQLTPGVDDTVFRPGVSCC